MAIDWDAKVIGPTVKTFGEPITITYQAGAQSGKTIAGNGVFDEAYLEIDLATGTPVSSQRPVIGIRLADWPQAPGQDDLASVVRTGERFVVKEPRPDGHGWMKLLLNTAPS